MRTRAAAFGLARQQCRNLPRQRFASSAQTTPQAAILAAPYDIKLKKLQRDSCERTLRTGHGWARCKSIDSRSGFLVFRHTRFGSRADAGSGFTQVEMPVTSSATQIVSRDAQGPRAVPRGLQHTRDVVPRRRRIPPTSKAAAPSSDIQRDARGAGEPLSACVASRSLSYLRSKTLYCPASMHFRCRRPKNRCKSVLPPPGACPPMRVQNARRGAALVANKCPGR